MPPPVPLLGAPTASGKSAVAIELAQRYPLEVITADAMQVYRGMDIGTAKPTARERRGVPHHLIDLVTPADPFSVADWVAAAERVIAEVQGRGNVPLVVGGTGFYLQALMNGLPTVPPASELRQEPIWRELEERGIDALEGELRGASPADADRSQRNPRRLVRALEILRHTGRPPSDFPFTTPRFRCSLAVLQPSMEVLRPRIEERCAQMFAAGLVDEVRALLARYPTQMTALQAIGYKEVVAELAAGEESEKARAEVDGIERTPPEVDDIERTPPEVDEMERARTEVEAATLRYAKRQLTWFRKQPAELRLPVLAHEAIGQLDEWLAKLGWRAVG